MKLPAMKPGLVAGLFTSVLLLGACASSPSNSHTAAPASGYTPKTGQLATTWGQLPTYSLRRTDLRKFRYQFGWLPAFFAGRENTATVDVLVNRDGTVRDVSIVKSSGDRDQDAMVGPRFAGIHITTKIAPEDPAPYVFRTVVTFQKTPGGIGTSDSNYIVTNPQPHYAEQPVSNPNPWVAP